MLDANRGERLGHAQRGDDRAPIVHHEIAEIHLAFDAIVEAHPQSVIRKRVR
ncbi:MAG TPA: hypothetical protein VMW17_06870 [Candidatus Binatia bacterium]|nr:hypothetical protein [Candidatus Binatia bacterium]